MTYQSTILADNPTAYYPLNGNANDATVHLFHGSVHGGVTFNQPGLLSPLNDPSGSSANFDGSTGYIGLPTTVIPTGNVPWSIEGWASLSQLTPSQRNTIVGMGQYTNGCMGELQGYAQSNTWVLTGFSADINSPAGTISTGIKWYTVGTYDGSQTHLYINNGQAAVHAFNISLIPTFASIGAGNSPQTDWCHGNIQHVAIYNYALSTSQVATHFWAGAQKPSSVIFVPPAIVPTHPFTSGLGLFTVTLYGGYDPGTFQSWALNLQQQTLGVAGIVRGLQVTPAASGLQVQVGVDATAQDGICYLPNGCWLRITAAYSLAVPANTSGQSRQDAVLAVVDPTGTTAATTIYQTNYPGGWKLPNQPYVFPIALVTVPNAASSLAQSNIVMTPYVANIGTAPPTLPDAVGIDDTVGGTTAEVFTQLNVTATNNAAPGQTVFNLPLSPYQRLVPMGKIGGQDEVGYFASPKGWYQPLVLGSVSGPLPVQSVSYLVGQVVTAFGAQSGETVTISFKYYDFSRDLHTWSGVINLDRTSPYLVYQADTIRGRGHLNNDLWDGVQNGYILPEVSTPIICTFYGLEVITRVASAQTATYTVSLDGAAPSTVTVPYSPDLGPFETANVTKAAAVGIHQLAITTGNAVLEFAGVKVVVQTFPAYYNDGGQAVVDGFEVQVTNTSLAVFPATQGSVGVVYTDRFGNLTSSFANLAPPFGEVFAGRVPVAQALQYGGMTQASTMYGMYALPNTNPLGLPTYILAGTTNHWALPGASNMTHGWTLQTDIASPYGAEVVTNSTGDALIVSGWMSGLDYLYTTTLTASVKVLIDNITSYTALLPTPPAGGRTRLTAFTTFPLGVHEVQFLNQSGGTGLALEAFDLRVPAAPAAPFATLPLAYVYCIGNSAWQRQHVLKNATHNLTSGVAQIITDPLRNANGPTITLTGNTTGQQLLYTVFVSGAFRINYLVGPDAGIFNVVTSGTSSWATIDSYNALYNATATPWYFLPTSDVQTGLGIASTGNKNGSSSNTRLYFLGLDIAPNPSLVIDARRFPADGNRPTILGSGILGAKGEAWTGLGPGILTEHLRDRSVTSRKLTPSWVRTVTAVAFSGFTTWSADPNLVAGINVEVPSVLFVTVAGSVNVLSGIGFQSDVWVDGRPHAINSPTGIANAQAFAVWTFDNKAASSASIPFGGTVAAIVAPGNHTAQLFMGGKGSASSPFFDGTSAREMTITAYAL